MTRLSFEPWVIESYEHGWQIGQQRTYQSGEREGQTYLAQVVYRPTMQSALEAVLEHRLRESDAQSVAELLSEVRAFKAQLASLFAFTVIEPRSDR